LKASTEQHLDKNIFGQFIFKLVRAYVKICLNVYFKKIDLINKPEKVNSPILLASNHQNAFLDAILIVCYTNTPVWFLTRADLFKKPILKKILNFFNMLPMFRERDGVEGLQQISGIENQCIKLFKRGEWVGIFPEATHDQRWVLRPVRKGTARLLYAALSKNVDLELRAAGIFYHHHLLAGTKVTLNFSTSILVEPISDTPKALWVNKVTTLLQEALAKLIPNVEYNNENYEAYEKLILESILKFKNASPKEILSYVIQKVENLKDSEANDQQTFQNKVKRFSLISKEKLEKSLVQANSFGNPFLNFLLPIVNKICFFALYPGKILIDNYCETKPKDKQFVPSLKFAFYVFLWPLYSLFIYLIINLFQFEISLFQSLVTTALLIVVYNKTS